MKTQNRVHILVLAAAILAISSLFLQGCGGAGTGVSSVSGTIADVNRNPIVCARVWVEQTHQTDSLSSGAYKLNGVPSGWRTVWASATIDGKTWVGSTAAEILKDQPTMNIHIVLAPITKTMEVQGTVYDDSGYRVAGARVLVTTRLLASTSPEDTDAYDGPYGSIVAVTDKNGDYLMDSVPTGLDAVITASKVGFLNRESPFNDDQHVDFHLVPSNLQYKLNPPVLDAVESYTMPSTITRSGDRNVYEAIKALTSPRYLGSFPHKKQVLTRLTPEGSLIEIDLYFNALHANDSTEVAGYGIYRRDHPGDAWRSLDFVRDPYANFYGDTGPEITPDQEYYYAVSAVDMQFLDANNNADPGAESDKSTPPVAIRPLGQLASLSPAQRTLSSAAPQFTWSPLNGASYYKVFVYDEFPTLVPDPSRDYTSSTPPAGVVDMPIWPADISSTANRTTGTSIQYAGPALVSGHTYYWFVMARDDTGAAVSYSELRNFTVR
jgi:hypothetical protein